MTTIAALLLFAPPAVPASDGEAAIERSLAFLKRAGISAPRVAGVGMLEAYQRPPVWEVKLDGWQVNVVPRTGRVFRAFRTGPVGRERTIRLEPDRASRAAADRIILREAWHPNVRFVSAHGSANSILMIYAATVDGLRFSNYPGHGAYFVGFDRKAVRFSSFVQEGDLPPVDRRSPRIGSAEAMKKAENYILTVPGRRPEKVDRRQVTGEFWFLRKGEGVGRRVFAILVYGQPKRGLASSGPMFAGATVLVDRVTGETFSPNSGAGEWLDQDARGQF